MTALEDAFGPADPVFGPVTEHKADYFVGDAALSDEARDSYAARNGLAIVYPEANELQIDIDTPEDFDVFTEQLARLKATMGWRGIFAVSPSKSGLPKCHVTVWFDRGLDDDEKPVPVELSRLERVALQACLGSDRTRELLSYVRLIKGHEHPTVFFEPATEVS